MMVKQLVSLPSSPPCLNASGLEGFVYLEAALAGWEVSSNITTSVWFKSNNKEKSFKQRYALIQEKLNS
jgi:hypothetical protein